MARKKEQRLWDRVRRNLTARGVHLERIENLVGVGMPDVLALACGQTSLVELKAVEEVPARKSTALLGNQKGLNVDQRNWHKTWAKNRGKSFLLVGIGGTVQFLLTGNWADAINNMTVDDIAEVAVAKDWYSIAVMLGSNK